MLTSHYCSSASATYHFYIVLLIWFIYCIVAASDKNTLGNASYIFVCTLTIQFATIVMNHKLLKQTINNTCSRQIMGGLWPNLSLLFYILPSF